MICWLTINRACNMACKWCYARADGFKSGSTMSLNTFRQILCVLSETKISRFVLLGGEPTIHEDLPLMIAELKPAKVVLVTNAVRLADKGYLAKLIDQGLDIVTLSIKGSTEKQYLENTGLACLYSVRQAIENLNELGVQYSVSITFSESLFKTLHDMLRLLKSVGVKTISINYCRPVVLKDGVDMSDIPHPKDMAEQTIQTYDLIQSSGIRCVYNFMLPLCLLPIEFIQELVSKDMLTTICQLQKHNGLIFTPDGSLIPCNHLFQFPFGKIGEDFTSAAEFGKFMDRDKVRGFYDKTSRLPDKRCQTCSLVTRCGGGCLIQYLQYKPADILCQPFERSIK